MKYMLLIYEDEKAWGGMGEAERQKMMGNTDVHAGPQGERQVSRRRPVAADDDRNERQGAGWEAHRHGRTVRRNPRTARRLLPGGCQGSGRGASRWPQRSPAPGSARSRCGPYWRSRSPRPSRLAALRSTKKNGRR